MFTLISKSYSETEAQRYRTYQLTEQDQLLITQASNSVLERFPPMRHACVPMSTLLASMIRQTTSIPIHVVAGNLRFGNWPLFGSDVPSEAWPSYFSASNAAWDGHCWVVVGGRIVEISLLRSAYHPKSPDWLRKAVVQQFGKGKGLIVATADGMRSNNLTYDPQYVLTSDQIEYCSNGAIEIIRANLSRS